MIENYLALSAALSAALETKLLGSLLEAPRAPADHAHALGIDPRATERVLEVLVAFGFASRTGDRVGASDELAAWSKLSPIPVEQMVALWGHTTQFLKTGKPFMRMDTTDKGAYANVVGGLGRMADGAARAFAGQLGLAPMKKILDIGCGSGVWSLAIAARTPDARVTGLDRPEVLEAFRARAAEVGLAGRIDTIAGDVHEVAIPRDFDVVVVANVLRLDVPGRAQHIVERAAGALAPGGTLIVVDALAGGTPERDRAHATYALHLAMRTENGRTYSPETVIGWMQAAGVADCRLESLSGPGAVGAIVGRHP